MEEIWKDVKGYEGLYQVSNLGRVKSLNKKVNTINQYGAIHKRTIKGRNLKQRETHNGYLRVKFIKNKKIQKVRVHRLVAEAFIEKPKLEVNHIDGNKKNNNVENLEWVTPKENKKHAWIMGLYSKKRRITYDKARTNRTT